MLLTFIYNEAIHPFVIGIHLLRWKCQRKEQLSSLQDTKKPFNIRILNDTKHIMQIALCNLHNAICIIHIRNRIISR